MVKSDFDSWTGADGERLMKIALAAARAALADEGLDIQAEVGTVHPHDTELRLFVRRPLPARAEQQFVDAAPRFGLDRSDFGRIFVWDNVSWHLVGLNPSRPTRPVIALRIPSGASRSLPKDALWAVIQSRGQPNPGLPANMLTTRR